MRIITCSIRNVGNGDIVWVDDHLYHGEWSDGKAPSESTNIIKPGETRTFEAVSGGDIPIIGSIGTGTEGWVLFRTLFSEFIGMPGTAFIKVSWNIPFITFDSDDGAKYELTRYDPRQVIGPGQFDDRDKTPPTMKISGIVAGPGGGDHVIDGLPWVFICPPMVITGAKIGVNMTLEVSGTATPNEIKFPSFSFEQNVTPIPEPMKYTNTSMWTGYWAGDNVSARIYRQDDNLLNVTITEREHGNSLTLPSQIVSINRLTYSLVNIESAMNLNSYGIMVGGSNLVANSGISNLVTNSGISNFAAKNINLYVQEGLGTSFAVCKPIDRRTSIYKEILSDHPDIVASFANQQHQIGSDYLRLQPDSTLEIYKMIARGKVVDVRLRYRRPASAMAHFDEMLKFYPDLH